MKRDVSQAYALRNNEMSLGSIGEVFNNVENAIFTEFLHEAQGEGCKTIAEYLREIVLERHFEKGETQ